MYFKYSELDSNFINNFIKEYINEKPKMKYMLEKFNISQYTFYKILNDYNVPRNELGHPSEVYIKALEYHKAGNKMKDTCNKFGITQSGLNKFMQKRSITYYSNKGRKNFFDKDFFKKIDTQEKAYWFGFLYADGSIYKSNKYDKEPNRVKVNISNKDIELLENFLIDLNAKNIKIKTYKPSPDTFSDSLMSTINLNSIDMCRNMVNNGFRLLSTQASPDVFNYIPKKLTRHFIRGYFDGDGSININKTVSFSGQKSFLLKIQEILKGNNIDLTKIYTYNDKRKDLSFNLKISTRENQTKKMYDYLYTDAKRFLKRKHDRFL